VFPKSDSAKALQVNILDIKELKKVCYEEKPDVIIHTAALTNVDQCEKDRKLAWELNVTSVENLLSISRVLDCHFIFFSTDYIFDGMKGPYSEEDRPNPISFYGKTKHASENACIVGHNKSTVIRTNVVYGYSSFGKSDFISWLISRLESGSELNIVDGQYCNPTFTDDIARAVIKIIDKKRYGIYNVAGADWLSRYDIALKVAKVFGFDTCKIKSIQPGELKQAAKRPNKGGLVTLKAETDLGIKFTNMENGLLAYRHQLNEKIKSSFVRL
jgi:dTDP-4-dehydrorhamnose reductase